MKIYKAKDYKDMSRKAANIISAQVIMKPDCVLGLATGSSPLGIYRQLIDWYNKGDVDFSECYSVLPHYPDKTHKIQFLRISICWRKFRKKNCICI